MGTEKLVFLQVEADYKDAMIALLGKFNDSDFHFFVLPLDAKILTKADIKQLLEEAQ